jgi:hypothetical protein
MGWASSQNGRNLLQNDCMEMEEKRGIKVDHRKLLKL